jgi:phosphoserine phosphatase
MKKVTLKKPGWHPDVKLRLESLIEQRSGQGLPVVLDMDNTILCGDIGEATFRVLEVTGKISAGNIPEVISPDFFLGNEIVSLRRNDSLYDYYQKLIVAASSHYLDKAKESVPHAWAVQILHGLTPLDVVEATELAFQSDEMYENVFNVEGKPTTLRPYFYPEMIELVGILLEHAYDVWVISSTNTWSVRWVLIKALNHFLFQEGFKKFLMASHVIGIDTLLIGKDKKTYKDNYLLYENSRYGDLDPGVLEQYRITSLLVPPIALSYGKIAKIFQWVGKSPYLVAGDSNGDLPMLEFGQNKLWIARLDLPKQQEDLVALLSSNQQLDTWIVQPTLQQISPGFLSNKIELKLRRGFIDQSIEKSLDILNSCSFLLDFFDSERRGSA